VSKSVLDAQLTAQSGSLTSLKTYEETVIDAQQTPKGWNQLTLDDAKASGDAVKIAARTA